MKVIRLNRNKFTLASEIDYRYLNRFKWGIYGKYVTRALPKKERVYTLMDMENSDYLFQY